MTDHWLFIFYQFIRADRSKQRWLNDATDEMGPQQSISNPNNTIGESLKQQSSNLHQAHLEAELASAKAAMEKLSRENEQLKLLVRLGLMDFKVHKRIAKVATDDGKIDDRLTIVALLRQIDQLKRERADICSQVEIEEESIINALQRRLDQVVMGL